MSGFQLDSLKATPPLDLPLPPPRAEPRRDDSFEEHLRRAAEPAPLARKEERPARNDDKSLAKEANHAAPPSSSTPENDKSPVQTTVAESQPAEKSPEDRKAGAKEGAKPDEAHEEERGEAAVAAVQAVLLASDPTPTGDESQAEAGLVVEKTPLAFSDTPLTDKNAHRTDVNLLHPPEASAAQPAQELQASTPLDQSLAEAAAELAEQQVAPTAPHDALPLEEPLSSAVARSAQQPSIAAHDESVEAARQLAEQTVDNTSVDDTQKSSGVRDRTTPERRAKGPESLAAQVESPAEHNAAEIPATPATTGLAADASLPKSEASQSATTEAVAPSNQQHGVTPPTARLPQHLLSRAADHAAPGKPLTEADQARFIQRVARAFQTAASQEGELRLRLSPPELGSLRLEVKVLSGVMSVRVEAESNPARSLLLENLPALRERLAEQNIRLEQFDVDLLDRQGSGQPGGAQQEQGRQTSGPADAAARFRLTEDSPEEPAPSRAGRRVAQEGQLNVLV